MCGDGGDGVCGEGGDGVCVCDDSDDGNGGEGSDGVKAVMVCVVRVVEVCLVREVVRVEVHVLGGKLPLEMEVQSQLSREEETQT
jgi:hypothetical protein